MKKVIVMAVMMLIAANMAKAQSIDDLDTKNGYKDIKFDMSADSIMKAVKVFRPLAQIGSNKSNLYYYQLPASYRRFAEFSFGGCSIAKIKNTNRIYSFSLYSSMESQTKLSKLIEFFKGLYGEPTVADAAAHTWTWKGNDVELMVSYDMQQTKSFLFPNITSEDLNITVTITSLKAREENRGLLAGKFGEKQTEF